MEAWITRFNVRRAIVFIMMRCGPMMLVCREPVVVVGMIVIGIRVNMQRRHVAGGRGQQNAEQDRD